MAAAPYANPLEHLVDELEWIRLLLKRQVVQKWSRGELSTRGLSVSEDEVLTFLGEDLAPTQEQRTLAGQPPNDSPSADLVATLPDIRAEIVAQRRAIDDRIAAQAAANGPQLSLPVLFERFGLEGLEQNIVRVLLAPELDPRFERAYCFAWNDFTRKRPSAGFLLELLGEDLIEMEAYRRCLEASGTLRQSGVVMVPLPPEREAVSFLSRTVMLAPRIVDFLRGRSEPDEAVARYAQRIEPATRIDRVVVPGAVKRTALQTLQKGSQSAPLVLLWGVAHSGKRTLAEALAREVGRPLWRVDLGALFSDQEHVVARLWALLRDARLSQALTLLDAGEDVPADGVPWSLATALADLLHHAAGPVVVTSPHRLPWLSKACPELVELTLPLPSPEERLRALDLALEQLGPVEKACDLDEVADRFGLPCGALVRAVGIAREQADLRGAGVPITRDELHKACRKELSHRLDTLADQIHTTFTWDDVVLPEETEEILGELLAFARNQRFVLDTWGFRQLLPYGSGLSVLFTGPPGTGKTMVAGILARDLGMPLFRVDLSRIVDKYVGETEKKLARIFDEAEQSHAILLFDEADSLFAKRTGVHSSVDRYANLEVNFLLQRMERFDGVTILTTNLDKNLDEAFKRRLKFHIPFPFPNEDARIELWERMIPEEVDLGEEIDFEDLAEYELTGAHIKNTVLRAAMLAADEGRALMTDDLHRSASQETAGMGKLVRDS